MIKRIVVFGIYTLIGVFALLKGAVYFPDSYAFLGMWFNRSPIYCLFLKLMTSIFGDAFEIPVIIIQYGLLIYAIHHLVSVLSKTFQFNFIAENVIRLILLSPCLYLHFVASTILSEGLAYPLLLLVLTEGFIMFKSESLKNLLKLCGLLVILILTRGQFIAAIPVFLIVSGYIAYVQRYSLKRCVPILLFLCVPLVSSFSEKVYNKVVHGYFVNNAMNYVHLISGSFYLANQSDANLFQLGYQRDYFKLVFSSLVQAELTRDDALRLNEDDYDYYLSNFSKICNARIHEQGLEYLEQKHEGINFYESNIALNTMCSKMVLPLFKSNFIDWLKFYFKALKTSFDSTKNMLLMLMILSFGIISLIKSNRVLYKFIVLILLLMLANNAIIALAVHAIKRYLFYFDWVIFVIVVLFISELVKNEKHAN